MMPRVFFFPDNRRYLLLTSDALAHMYAHAQTWPWKKEAGGEIYSPAPAAHGLVVTTATGPNTKDRRSRHHFNPDVATSAEHRYQQFAIGRHAVGLWHTHPEVDPAPSAQDQETARSYLSAFAGERDRYLLIILGNSGKPLNMTVWVADFTASTPWYPLAEVPGNLVPYFTRL